MTVSDLRSPARVVTSSRSLTNTVAALILVVSSLYVLSIWLDLREAWLHPELYGSSQYIWGKPNEHVLRKLKKALDWKAFDPNVNRVRPISDAADTFDTVARPYLTRVIGPHPSITPTSIFTAIVSPLCLFLFFRLAGLDAIRSAALTALFLSCLGFLSVLIDYIRPAKKATMVAFCIALFLAQWHARTRSTSVYMAFCLTVFGSFFADELALGLYPILAILYFPSLLLEASWRKRAAFLALPVGFLVMTLWGLPWIYATFSVHGAWSALADTKKFTVFEYLLTPVFYTTTLKHVADAFLTTIGVRTHTIVTEGAILVVLGVVTALTLLRRADDADLRAARFGMVTSAAAIMALGCWVTLLDMYPDISQLKDRSYLGSYTYYYHSPLVLPIILWLAFTWQYAARAVGDRVRAQRAVLAGGMLLCGVAVVGNFAMFPHVNRIVQLIHTYPYATEQLFGELKAHERELLASHSGATPTIVTFQQLREPLAQEYEQHLRAVFGDRWQENDFYWSFESFKVTPIMKEGNLKDLVHAYYPYAVFEVRIR